MPLLGAAPAMDVVPYQVRDGENLFNIALAYFRTVKDYKEVQRLNGIADPYSLTPNTTLLIPRGLLRWDPIEARVVAFRGPVTIDGTRRASVGVVLREGASITTGTNASVSFTLADATRISLPSSSAIRIVRLRKLAITGQVERTFQLDSGRTDAEVTPTRGHDPFQIRTPVSVAAVRGTIFRVALTDGGQVSTAGVTRGEIGVSGKTGETIVPTEYGVRTDAKSTGEAVPLLAPPDFDPPVHVRPNGRQVFNLAVSPGAARYRVQIASDGDFNDVKGEATSTQPTLELPPIADGTYFVRATAIDANNIEGLASDAYRYTYARPAGAKDAAAPAK